MKRRYTLLLVVALAILTWGLSYHTTSAKEGDQKGEGSSISVDSNLFLGNLKVDPKEGYLTMDFSLVSLRGNMAPSLRAYYHSNNSEKGQLGKGWTTNLEAKIVPVPKSQTLVLIEADRNLITFKKTPSGHYKSTTGALEIIRETAGRYILQKKRGWKYHFSLQGKLEKISDGRGQYLKVVYGSSGPVQVTNHLQQSIRIHYKDGRWHSVVGSDGQSQSFEYDKKGNLLALVNPRGANHLFHYNPQGLVDKVNRGAAEIRYNRGDQVSMIEGSAVAHAYYRYFPNKKNDLKMVTEVVDGRGNISYYQYSKDERTVSLLDPVGRTTIYYMNKRNLPSVVIAPGHNITRYKYDENFNLVEYTQPGDQSYKFRYDEGNHMVSVEKPDGSVYRMDYDRYHNMTAMIRPDGSKYEFAYNQQGDVVKAKQPNGLAIEYTYDKKGNVTSRKDNTGLDEKYGYDKSGRIASITRGKLQIQLAYSGDGKKVTLTNNMNMKLSVELNDRGQIEKYTGPNGKSIDYKYGTRGRLEGVNYPNGAFTSFRYDDVGNLVSLIDPAGRIYGFGYDSVDRQNSWMDPTGKVTKYKFDKKDQEIQKVLPNGKKVVYHYDEIGQLSKVVYPNDTATFTYDSRGNLKSMKNKDSWYEFRHDVLGRPLVMRDKMLKQELRYSYNSRGLRESLTTPYGKIRYQYDNAGRPVKITGAKGGVTKYEYNQMGLQSQVNFPNGVVTTYDYDALGRLATLKTVKNGKVLVKRAYTYDKNSNRRKVVNEKGQTTKYAYDLRGQLVKVATSGQNVSYGYDKGGNRTTTGKIRYRYDNAGNRIAKKDGATTTYAYDRVGRIAVRGKTRYKYDTNGNLSGKMSPKGATRYEYDSRNKLRKVTMANGETVEFGYAPTGARVWKKVNGRLTRFLYDFEDVVAEYGNNGRRLEATYLHGPGIDNPISFTKKGRPVRYYHSDGLTSVSALTDKSGAVVGRYAYGPFGEVIQEWGKAADDNPYRFSGRWYDSETGLYNFRARYYDPTDGRFTSQDPMMFGGGTNLYAYCGNNPVNYIDAWGTKRSFWGMLKDAGEGVGLLVGVGPKEEVRAMRKGFTDSLFSKQTLTNAVAFGRGFGKGVWGGVKGVYNTVRHPIQTAKAIYHAVENFDETKAAIGKLIDDYVDAAYNDPEKFAEMTGQLTGELVFAIAGTKGLDKLGKLSHVAKLKGVAKAKVLSGTNRLSRFANAAKASRLAKKVAPVAGALKTGAKKVGGAYVYSAGRKISTWSAKRIAGVGRGTWKMAKRTGLPMVVAFNDNIEKAIKTHKTDSRAFDSVNGEAKRAIKEFGGNISSNNAEIALNRVDEAFNSYRDYLYKPVHDNDVKMKNEIDGIVEAAERGDINQDVATARLEKVFVKYGETRLTAMESVYGGNKPEEGYRYVDDRGRLSNPVKNRLASYNNQIELYKHLASRTGDAGARRVIEDRIKDLETRRDADAQDYMSGNVDLGDSTNDGTVPEKTTPGAIDRLGEMNR